MKKPKRSKLSSLIVLLVVDETDGAGLQSEGVKVKVGGVEEGGWESAQFFLFFSFVESPNFCRAKKKCKKRGTRARKNTGWLFFFFLPLHLFAFAPHMFEGFSIWLPKEACQPITERGVRPRQSRTGSRMMETMLM